METTQQTSSNENIHSKSTKHSKRKKIKIILLSLLVLLIIFRLLLPYIVLKYVNNKLANLEEYYGHVEDIDIALIRGAYVIKDIKLVKLGNEQGQKDTIPFFKSTAIDLSVQWKAIFKGRIVGEIYVEDPVVNFVKGKHKDEDAKADTADFRQLIKDLMPLTVNHFEISNGQIHYIDPFSSPRVDVAMKELEIVATNLSNVNDSNKVLPANAVASASVYEGDFKLRVDFDALQKMPTFDMSAEIKNVNLALLNDFLKAYGNFDTKKGNFGVYTEFAGKDGGFGGYIKPVIKDLDIVQWNKEEGDFKQILWETLIGSAAEVLQNQDKEQLATKVDINGKFEDPNINIWRAISFVLRNAFVRALRPSIDNTINITKLKETKDKTLLEKVFGDKNKKGDSSKDSKKDKKQKEKKKNKKKRK
ncbi:hypothetical protein CNR22_14200 [Sphingobacteriaceae bacterium]|nr:hypothetical protein CNR22_14200 [Sphingobacteriaceae bacterium]